MNNRYTRIITTCFVVGSLTLALKQNNQGNIPANKIPSLKTSVDAQAQPVQANPVKKSVKTSSSSITIRPNISSDDLKVHKFGTHSPKSITLTVNDREITVNNNDPITVKVDGTSNVTTICDYAFIANHKGVNQATWKVQPGQEYEVTFDWNNPEKITLSGKGATLIETHKLSADEIKERKTNEKPKASNVPKKKVRK